MRRNIPGNASEPPLPVPVLRVLALVAEEAVEEARVLLIFGVFPSSMLLFLGPPNVELASVFSFPVPLWLLRMGVLLEFPVDEVATLLLDEQGIGRLVAREINSSQPLGNSNRGDGDGDDVDCRSMLSLAASLLLPGLVRKKRRFSLMAVVFGLDLVFVCAINIDGKISRLLIFL